MPGLSKGIHDVFWVSPPTSSICFTSSNEFPEFPNRRFPLQGGTRCGYLGGGIPESLLSCKLTWLAGKSLFFNRNVISSQGGSMNFMATLSFTRGCNSSPLKNKWFPRWSCPFWGFRRIFREIFVSFIEGNGWNLPFGETISWGSRAGRCFFHKENKNNQQKNEGTWWRKKL